MTIIILMFIILIILILFIVILHCGAELWCRFVGRIIVVQNGAELWCRIVVQGSSIMPITIEIVSSLFWILSFVIVMIITILMLTMQIIILLINVFLLCDAELWCWIVMRDYLPLQLWFSLFILIIAYYYYDYCHCDCDDDDLVLCPCPTVIKVASYIVHWLITDSAIQPFSNSYEGEEVQRLDVPFPWNADDIHEGQLGSLLLLCCLQPCCLNQARQASAHLSMQIGWSSTDSCGKERNGNFV